MILRSVVNRPLEFIAKRIVDGRDVLRDLIDNRQDVLPFRGEVLLRERRLLLVLVQKFRHLRPHLRHVAREVIDDAVQFEVLVFERGHGRLQPFDLTSERPDARREIVDYGGIVDEIRRGLELILDGVQTVFDFGHFQTEVIEEERETS